MAGFANGRNGLVIPEAMTVASPDPDPKWTHAKLPYHEVRQSSSAELCLFEVQSINEPRLYLSIVARHDLAVAKPSGASLGESRLNAMQ
jgi:hypothetical protein